MTPEHQPKIRGIPSLQSSERSTAFTWQARRDLNPQPPDLESGALPLELLAFSLLRGDAFPPQRGWAKPILASLGLVPFQTIFAKLLARHDADCCRKACCSDSAHEVGTALAPCSPPCEESSVSASLLCFLVGSVLATPTAKLLQLDPVGRILFILFRRVVPPLALTAG